VTGAVGAARAARACDEESDGQPSVAERCNTEVGGWPSGVGDRPPVVARGAVSAAADDERTIIDGIGTARGAEPTSAATGAAVAAAGASNTGSKTTRLPVAGHAIRCGVRINVTLLLC
jgi:hypothetical protein